MSEDNQTTKSENPTQQTPPTTPVEETAVGAPAKPLAHTHNSVSLLTVIIVSSLLSAFSSFVVWNFAVNGKTSSQPVVMVDGAKLVEIQSKISLAKPGMNAEMAAKEGKEFVTRLNAALKEYDQAGVIVVNSSVVLNRPTVLDATPQVAQKLGLKME